MPHLLEEANLRSRIVTMKLRGGKISRRSKVLEVRLREMHEQQYKHDADHERTATGGHGLPIVSPGPAIPYPSTPCGRATPETALWPF
jgi:hypothetical protein